MSYFSQNFDYEVISLLKSGAVGFMPSDTIYGLSCRALDETAVSNIHRLKDRSGHKPFIVLVSNTEMLNMLSIDPAAAEAVSKYWPGGLSAILPAPQSPAWLTLGTATIAVRIPKNQGLRNLLDATGPLVSTSANIENQPPAKNVDEAKRIFGDKLDFYIDMGELSGQPSTLVRVSGSQLEVIRQGTVKI